MSFYKFSEEISQSQSIQDNKSMTQSKPSIPSGQSDNIYKGNDHTNLNQGNNLLKDEESLITQQHAEMQSGIEEQEEEESKGVQSEVEQGDTEQEQQTTKQLKIKALFSICSPEKFAYWRENSQVIICLVFQQEDKFYYLTKNVNQDQISNDGTISIDSDEGKQEIDFCEELQSINELGVYFILGKVAIFYKKELNIFTDEQQWVTQEFKEIDLQDQQLKLYTNYNDKVIYTLGQRIISFQNDQIKDISKFLEKC